MGHAQLVKWIKCYRFSSEITVEAWLKWVVRSVPQWTFYNIKPSHITECWYKKQYSQFPLQGKARLTQKWNICFHLIEREVSLGHLKVTSEVVWQEFSCLHSTWQWENINNRLNCQCRHSSSLHKMQTHCPPSKTLPVSTHNWAALTDLSPCTFCDYSQLQGFPRQLCESLGLFG